VLPSMILRSIESRGGGSILVAKVIGSSSWGVGHGLNGPER
jgi:hypothetical protein